MKKYLNKVFSLVFVMFLLTGCKQQTETANIEEYVEENEVQYIEAYGNVVAGSVTNIGFDFPFEIVETKIQNGQKVTKGEVLFTIDYNNYLSQVKQKETELQIAQLEIDELYGNGNVEEGSQDAVIQNQLVAERTELGSVSEDYNKIKSYLVEDSGETLKKALYNIENQNKIFEMAEKEYNDYVTLYDEGMASEAELLQKELAKNQESFALDEAKSSYELLKESFEEDLDDLDYQKKKLQSSIIDLEEQLQSNDITYQLKILELSIIEDDYNQMIEAYQKDNINENGEVICNQEEAIFYNFNKETGDYLVGDKSEVIYSLLNPTELEVHTEVPEDFIDGVELGANANILPIASRGKEYKGTVTYIGDMAYESGNEFVVMVHVSVDNEDGLLKPNFSVDLEIENAE